MSLEPFQSSLYLLHFSSIILGPTICEGLSQIRVQPPATALKCPIQTMGICSPMYSIMLSTMVMSLSLESDKKDDLSIG
jgi:hypothetical protein